MLLPALAGGRLLRAGVGLILHHWWVLNNNLQVPFRKGQKNPKGMEGKGTLKEFALLEEKNLFSVYYSVFCSREPGEK